MILILEMGRIFSYSYTAEITIEASVSTVWSVLTDLKNYHHWNAFTPKIETNWEIGEKVLLTVQMKNRKTPILQKERLRVLSPPFTIIWGINWGIFLKAERVQQLTEISGEQTNYFTEDKIHGFVAPLVHLLYGKSIQSGFRAVVEGLKKYAEKG